MKFDFDKALSFPFEIEKEEIEKDFLKWSNSKNEVHECKAFRNGENICSDKKFQKYYL